MKEGRLWLTPEKESKEFECDDQYFSSKLEIVKINKAIVDKIKAKDELTAQEITDVLLFVRLLVPQCLIILKPEMKCHHMKMNLAFKIKH